MCNYFTLIKVKDEREEGTGTTYDKERKRTVCEEEEKKRSQEWNVEWTYEDD